MKRKRIAFFLLFCFVSIALYLYFSRIYSFLAINRPVIPDILIVEGWLPENSIDMAYREFYASGYRSVITTGFPYSRGFMMGSEGELRFIIPGRDHFTESALSVTITARGTRACHEFPHFRLYADTVLIGESYTHSKILDYTFLYQTYQFPSAIIIDFDNDAYSRLRDRNLVIYSVTVDGVQYNVNHPNVTYYIRKKGRMDTIPDQKLNVSKADETAVRLIELGIPDSSVIPVPSEHKIKSKTYTNGLDVYTWFQQNPDQKIKSVTILTSGSHARRSYVSYRKAIQDKSIEIGVISCYDPQINKTNWWKTRKGVQEILYETIGLLYAKALI
jgi:hypothetical protein